MRDPTGDREERTIEDANMKRGKVKKKKSNLRGDVATTERRTCMCPNLENIRKSERERERETTKERNITVMESH